MCCIIKQLDYDDIYLLEDMYTYSLNPEMISLREDNCPKVCVKKVSRFVLEKKV